LKSFHFDAQQLGAFQFSPEPQEHSFQELFRGGLTISTDLGGVVLNHNEQYPLTPIGTEALLRDLIRDLKSGLIDVSDPQVRENLRELRGVVLQVLKKVADSKA